MRAARSRSRPLGEVAGVVEDEALLLGPGAEHARPVLVIVVEALPTARHEELAAALQALLDEADLLGPLVLELLALGQDLRLEVVQVGLALLRFTYVQMCAAK